MYPILTSDYPTPWLWAEHEIRALVSPLPAVFWSAPPYAQLTYYPSLDNNNNNKQGQNKQKYNSFLGLLIIHPPPQTHFPMILLHKGAPRGPGGYSAYYNNTPVPENENGSGTVDRLLAWGRATGTPQWGTGLALMIRSGSRTGSTGARLLPILRTK